MRLCVIGTGYVGLVAGACFAEMGNYVICVDVIEEKIEKLKRGIVPIYEPELDSLVERNLKEGRLEFTTDLKYGVQRSKVVFIAVGTPERKDGSADLSQVFDVAEKIGRYMNGYKIVVTKSTVPVGTGERIKEIISKHTKHRFDVASNPEFMKEGAAVLDFMKPDRVVLGTESEKAAQVLKDLYAPFVRTEKPIYTMDIRSAELTKYAANAFLAAKVSYMNELANLCEKLGADIMAVRRGMCSDSRIGFQFSFPGVGFGGSCFPKDTKALVNTAKQAGADVPIVRAAIRINERQRTVLADKVIEHYGGRLSDKVLAVWGLSFKPHTDDMREAPAIYIINKLLKYKPTIKAYDPVAMENARRIFKKRIQLCENGYEAANGADALLVVTEWPEFRRPDFDKLKRIMRTKVIFDGRNIYTPKLATELGFTYYGIGRRPDAE